jgi:hypothetical protein
VSRIAATVDGDYGRTRILFWGGLAATLLLLALRARRSGRSGALSDPYVLVVVPTMLVLAAFSLTDFQGYPDLYPLLPYAALGVGGAVALAVRGAAGTRMRVPAAAVAFVAVAALAGASWAWYGGDRASRPSLVQERAHAAAAARLAPPGRPLYAIGDPALLVLTGRRNPSRYIYLGSGVEEWMLRRTPGGFAGWQRRILAARPGVIAVAGWEAPDEQRLSAWLHTVRAARHLGRWELFVEPVRG